MSSSVSNFHIYIKAHTFHKVKISLCSSGNKDTVLHTVIYMHAYQLNKLAGKGTSTTLIGKGEEEYSQNKQSFTHI